MENTGTAQPSNGTAAVRLDPTFCRFNRSEYFVSRNDDVERRRFDYRIVATALGQADQGMAPETNAASVARIVLPVVPKRPLVRPTLVRP